MIITVAPIGIFFLSCCSWFQFTGLTAGWDDRPQPPNHRRHHHCCHRHSSLKNTFSYYRNKLPKRGCFLTSDSLISPCPVSNACGIFIPSRSGGQIRAIASAHVVSGISRIPQSIVFRARVTVSSAGFLMRQPRASGMSTIPCVG